MAAAMIDTGSGNLVVPIAGSTSSTSLPSTSTVVGVYTSTNNGTTWTWAQISTGGGPAINEPQFCVGQGAYAGTWYLSYRNSSALTCPLYSTTGGIGGTWTLLTTLTTAYAAPRIICMADGTLVIASRSSVAPIVGCITWSNNGGTTWLGRLSFDQRQGTGWFDYAGICEEPTQPGVINIV